MLSTSTCATASWSRLTNTWSVPWGPRQTSANSSTPRPFDCFHGQVRDKNQEKKSYEQQVSAMRNVMAKETVLTRV